MRETKYSKTAVAGIWYALFGLFFVIAVTVTAIAAWYIDTFNLEFKDLLFVLASPLKGTGTSTIADILSACMPWAVAAAIAYVLIAGFLSGPNPKYKPFRKIGAWLCTASLVGSLVFSVFAFRLPGYISAISQQTTIYEDYYVNPDDVSITGEGKNLIHIYLESMETTYSAAQISDVTAETNFMPNLTALAQNHISFSDKEEGLGGFRSPQGTGWTMAALLSSTSGVPFSFPVSENSMSNRENFATGLNTLGDVLADKGYHNYFLCGSNATFGGRRLYFEQHGNYTIYDLYTAREDGYIPENYYVWWGYEDFYLYDIAKDKILDAAAQNEPFNFTMLTVDTHHVGGYRCKYCPYEHGTQLANVVSCADAQLKAFIDWCQTQPFMEDTVIVVTGDHRRMDKILVEGKTDNERTIYNCYIGLDPELSSTARTTSRIFTTMDLFPTTLAAMGFQIEGDRLGLGTNMFSGKDTLAEEIGYETLNKEIQMYSDFYIREFS